MATGKTPAVAAEEEGKEFFFEFAPFTSTAILTSCEEDSTFVISVTAAVF